MYVHSIEQETSPKTFLKGGTTMGEFSLVDSLQRYIGRTVTIFTTSGGASGCGFTGVLAGICDGSVRLITDIGAPPACPIGGPCCGSCGNSKGFSNGGNFGSWGNSWGNGSWGNGWGNSWGNSWGNGWGNGGWGFNGFNSFGNSGCGGGCCGGCCGNSCGCGGGFAGNWLGSVTEIPICRIASFTHNAI